MIQRPSIWVIDLKTDRLVHRYEIPDNLVNRDDARYLRSINVDSSDKIHCEDTYAYIANSSPSKPRLLVYSLKDNKIWGFADDTMKPEDKYADICINWRDYRIFNGICSIALGRRNKDRFRTVYYHPLNSYSEYGIASNVLRNPLLSGSISETQSSPHFKYIGTRGKHSQSNCHDYDLKTGVIFFSDLHENAITCWNTGRALNKENVQIVTKNDATHVYTADIKVDFWGNLWFLSNNFQLSFDNNVKTTNLNFFVYRRSIKQLIDDTVCDYDWNDFKEDIIDIFKDDFKIVNDKVIETFNKGGTTELKSVPIGGSDNVLLKTVASAMVEEETVGVVVVDDDIKTDDNIKDAV